MTGSHSHPGGAGRCLPLPDHPRSPTFIPRHIFLSRPVTAATKFRFLFPLSLYSRESAAAAVPLKWLRGVIYQNCFRVLIFQIFFFDNHEMAYIFYLKHQIRSSTITVFYYRTSIRVRISDNKFSRPPSFTNYSNILHLNMTAICLNIFAYEFQIYHTFSFHMKTHLISEQFYSTSNHAHRPAPWPYKKHLSLHYSGSNSVGVVQWSSLRYETSVRGKRS